MIFKRIAIVLLTFGLMVLPQVLRAEKVSQEPVIMVVLAHPDDETILGPVMAKYGAEGSEVHLVIATDGRYGVTEHAGIEAGDRLVAVRAKEAQCSTESLGIEPPIFVGLEDGFRLKEGEGLGDYFQQAALLKQELVKLFESIRPDIVITFGPDGDTGHVDHRLVGAITTEVYLQQDWSGAMSLYHFAWSSEQAAAYGDWNLGFVEQPNMTTVVDFTPEQEERGFGAIRCYASQYPEAEMDGWIQVEVEDTENRRYFRQVMRAEALKQGL